MDLLMGRFADADLARLPDPEVEQFEQLLEAQDRDVLAWLIGEAAVPEHYDTSLFRRLQAFHTHDAPLHS
jgi:antitoxin CptB